MDWVGTTWYSMYKARQAMHRMYGYPLWRLPEFRLSTHPLARAAMRNALRWRRMTGVAPIL